MGSRSSSVSSRAWRRPGCRDVYLTLNYKADVFEERLGTGEHLGVTLHYVRERSAMGTAAALSLLPDDLEGPVLVANGDLVTTVDFRSLLDFHWHHEGSITVTGVEHLVTDPVRRAALRRAPPAGDRREAAAPRPRRRRDLRGGGAGVALRARDAPSGMPDLIARAVGEGLPVHVFPILERWFDIGSPEEFERVLLHFAVARTANERAPQRSEERSSHVADRRSGRGTRHGAPMSEYPWVGRKVLVTGAEGFIGSTLVDRLLHEGARCARSCTTSPTASGAGSQDREDDVDIQAGDVRDAGGCSRRSRAARSCSTSPRSSASRTATSRPRATCRRT